MSEKVRKYLEYPMVIDWLQWSDEFRQELGKPDMPQIALTLIAEIKADLSKLTEINKVLVEALGKYGRHEKLCAEIGGYGYCSCGLEKAIAKAKETGR